MPRGTRACGSGCWRPFGGCPTGPTPPLPAGGPLLSGGGGGYRGGAAPGRGDGGRVSCHGGGAARQRAAGTGGGPSGGTPRNRRGCSGEGAGGKDGGCVGSGGGPAGADFNTVRQAVESAVRGWFDGRLLGQSVLRAQLGALIFRVEGVENYALTAPAADVAAAVDELPQLGTLTVAALEGRHELRGIPQGSCSGPCVSMGWRAPPMAVSWRPRGRRWMGWEAAMEEVQREMLICTAEGRGLEAVEALLARKPVAASLERRRAALAALLRIGGDSFTLTAINDNLKGCGLNAVASETETPGVVEVRFPDVPGIPDGFESMRGHPGGYSALPSGHTVCLLVHHLGPSWRSALPPGETLRSWGPPGRSWRRWCGTSLPVA